MTYSFAQLIDTFPEAIPAARRANKARIKELNRSISSLSDFRELWSNDINKIHFSLQPAYIEYLDDLVGRLHTGYEKEIKKCEYQLEYLKNYGKPVPEEKMRNDITPERVARAKEFPITELLDVKRGTTLCLWHDDHRPSMKVYPDNHVYCFSCARNADAIDVYMALNGVGFREAVRALAP